MTHDLMKNLLDQMGASIDRVVVCDLRENTFYATIHLRTADRQIPVDARPSDAIALALRTTSPIFVEEAVIVPRGPDETDAWLVAPSINLREGVTELHAFNATRVADGPVATWRADVALPAGFHGIWAG